MFARIVALFGLVLLIGSAAAHEYSSNGVTVIHPWARATPGGTTVGAAFFEMTAARGHDDRLIGAHSGVAGTSELHKAIMDGHVARMRRVDGIALRAGTSVVLKPGGYHVMLMDLAGPLKEGDLLRLTLVFEKAGALEVEATVEPVGATGPHGFDSQPAGNQRTHKH